MSFAALYYVFLVGVFLPGLSVYSHFKLKAGAPFPSKTTLRKQALGLHAFTFLLAWITWKKFGQPLFPHYAIRWKGAVLGVATLVAFVVAIYPVWKSRALKKREQLYRSVPQSAGEMRSWVLVSLSAGFVEEIVYRGVLFGILMHWAGNWWAAATLCAASFALGHAIQGWKATAIIFAMSIIFQGLVWVTGTLYVAMVVHASYDIIAGFAYLHLWKKTAPGVSGAAAAGVM
jgi:membrane protease YdiL (CAAX protease family)